MQSKRCIQLCNCKPATHGYCPTCKNIRPIAFRKATSNYVQYEGGRIVCEACDTVLVHLYRDQSPSPREKGRIPARLAYRSIS